jgi:hypothetical protein
LFDEKDSVKKRYGTHCLICNKELIAPSTCGTRHLGRHQRSCESKHAGVGKSQQTNGDGSVITWVYDLKRARVELVCLIARLDLNLGIGESDAFEEYIQRAHNPQYFGVSMRTTSRDIVKLFHSMRAKFLHCLQSSVSSIVVTSNIWSDNAKEDYLSVVVYYMNVDCDLQKRIFGL